MEIRYAHRAVEDKVEFLQFIVERFGERKAQDISKKLDRVIDLIASLPEMYPKSKRISGLRKCVFSKQTSIYYRIDGEVIEVVAIRSNYASPDSFRV